MINFIPVTIFAGYGLGRAEKDLPRIVTLGLITVVLFTSFLDAWHSSQRLGPIINEARMRELEELKENVPLNSVIVVYSRVFYWVQLVTGLKTFHG